MQSFGELTDCGESNKAEVRGVEELPVLPSFEQKSSANDVPDDEEDAEPYGDRTNVAAVGVLIEAISVERVLIHYRSDMTCLTVHCETHWWHNSRRWRRNFNLVFKQHRNDIGDRNKWENKERKINDFIISRWEKDRKGELSSANVGCNEMQNGTESWGSWENIMAKERKESHWRFKWKWLFPCQRISSKERKRKNKEQSRLKNHGNSISQNQTKTWLKCSFWYSNFGDLKIRKIKIRIFRFSCILEYWCFAIDTFFQNQL